MRIKCLSLSTRVINFHLYFWVFTQTIDVKIIKIAAFLNDFDLIVRSKIAALGEKLSRLERNVEFCEAAVKSTQDRLQREGKSG